MYIISGILVTCILHVYMYVHSCANMFMSYVYIYMLTSISIYVSIYACTSMYVWIEYVCYLCTQTYTLEHIVLLCTCNCVYVV